MEKEQEDNVINKKIEALKAIQDKETLVSLLNDIVDQLSPEDIEKLRPEKPQRGVDYLTEAEIQGLQDFIQANTDNIGIDLSNRLDEALRGTLAHIEGAINSIPTPKNGKDGKKGDKGEKGNDGSPDTPEEVATKLKKVKGAKRLSFENIKGLNKLAVHVKDNTDDIDKLKKDIKQDIAIGIKNNGGASALNDLSDVNISSLADGEVLIYNNSTGKWENQALATSGDMFKATYDTDDSGVVDNAELVNNLTVETAVPPSAVFTDTIYDDTAIQAEVDINTAKVSNANHTGDVTGSVALTIDPSAINGKPAKTVTGAEEILVNDAGTLKKTTAQEIADLASGGGSGATELEVTQASHGFSVGDVLTYTGGAYTEAQADSAANAEVIGIVTVVTDTDTFTITQVGYTTLLSGLTANTVYFLDETTAGAMTATQPSANGEISKPVFFATSTTSGWVLNYRGIEIASDDSVLTTKGDTLGHDGSDPVRVAVGTDGQVKVADSTADAGWSWQDASGGGSTTDYVFPKYTQPAYTVTSTNFTGNTTGFTTSIEIPHSITVNSIYLRSSGTPSVSGTLHLGIFSDDGQTRHINVTTPTISGSGAIQTSVSAVTLPAGRYYFVLVPNTTANIGLNKFSITFGVNMTASGDPIMLGTQTVTASTMPASFDPTTDITFSTSDYAPVLALSS